MLIKTISIIGSEGRFANDYRGILQRPNCTFHEFIDAQTGEIKMGIWVCTGIGKIKKGQEIIVNYGKSFWSSRGLLRAC